MCADASVRWKVFVWRNFREENILKVDFWYEPLSQCDTQAGSLSESEIGSYSILAWWEKWWTVLNKLVLFPVLHVETVSDIVEKFALNGRDPAAKSLATRCSCVLSQRQQQELCARCDGHFSASLIRECIPIGCVSLPWMCSRIASLEVSFKLDLQTLPTPALIHHKKIVQPQDQRFTSFSSFYLIFYIATNDFQ